MMAERRAIPAPTRSPQPDPNPAPVNPDGLRSVIRTILASSGRIAAASWGVVCLLWLLDAVGHGLPAAVDGLAVVLAAVALGAFLARAGRRLWAGEVDGGRGAGRALLLLAAVAAGFQFLGLGHELGSRYFGDEGIYLQHAREINGGQLFRSWFIYPHLLFYLDALALWIAALFEPLVRSAALLFDVEGELPVAALVTRWVTAGFGTLTVVPVFAIARRVAGTAAAVLAAALVALSPVYLEVTHLNVSDVPATFFATLTVWQVSRLLDRESTRGYVLAGLWAGLAAGSKYPAGVAAVAIVALWLRGRFRDRRFSWDLLWAGLTAIAAFVASTPSLVALAESVHVESGPDLLFGFRAYARGGWTGVVKDSNFGYYLGELRRGFGEPLLLLGVSGLALAGRAAWSRLAWLLPFPAVHLALILSMSMSVKRNLLPSLPMLAVVLGVGAAGWLRWLDRRWPAAGRRTPTQSALARAAVPALAAVCLALPALRSSALVIELARPTTRELAAAWMKDNLPPGSFLVQEAYTPRVGPPYHFPSRRPRFVTRLADEELRQEQYDFVFVADAAYSRFLNPQNRRHQGHLLDPVAERYREIFDTFERVREFVPGRLRAGPALGLYKIDPETPAFARERRFTAAEALLREERMRRDDDGSVVYRHAVQWSLFKAYLEAGRYAAEVEAEIAADGGTLRVMNRDNQELGAHPLAGTTAAVELPRADKYFFYLHLPVGSRLWGMAVAPMVGGQEPAG